MCKCASVTKLKAVKTLCIVFPWIAVGLRVKHDVGCGSLWECEVLLHGTAGSGKVLGSLSHQS